MPSRLSRDSSHSRADNIRLNQYISRRESLSGNEPSDGRATVPHRRASSLHGPRLSPGRFGGRGGPHGHPAERSGRRPPSPPPPPAGWPGRPPSSPAAPP